MMGMASGYDEEEYKCILLETFLENIYLEDKEGDGNITLDFSDVEVSYVPSDLTLNKMDRVPVT
jgi:hypothetical protein